MSEKIIPDPEQGVESWIGLAEVAQDSEGERNELGAYAAIRPSNFDQFIGQKTIKDNLMLGCSAAAKRKEPLDHVLFHGPPGLGKTSLARIVAQELGVGFKSTSGPVLERPGDLAAILSSLQERDVLFIDEIHRLPRALEEVLYPAMEDYHIDIIIGQGPAARTIKVELKPFTLIGATTRSGLLTSPLRDRFGIVLRLEFYSPNELQQIITRSADILGVAVNSDAAFEIARRSRGTPRIANRILKRVRDFAQERGSGAIDLATAREAVSALDVDQRGLDRMDRNFLSMIIDRFNGGPVGIEAVAATLGEDRETLEEVYEPYLLQEGFIVRGRRGREVTELAYSHLQREAKPSANTNLKLI